MTLGLEADRVELAPWSPEWAGVFDLEAAAIRRSLGTLVRDVQHIGSTAVPGLPAKPILDIGVALARAGDGEACRPGLAALGYRYVEDLGNLGGHFFVKGTERASTHHLHAVAEDDPQWLGYLTLRDHLRRDAEALERYRSVKLELAAAHPNDRDAYLRGKSGVVLQLIAEALAAPPTP